MTTLAPDRPKVLFVALQTGNRANGGIASLNAIMTSLQRYRPVVMTNLETQVTQSWRDQGIDVEVVPERASRGLRKDPVGILASYARYFLTVRRMIKRNRVEVVHANDPLAFQLALPAAKSIPGVRIALNIRDTLDPGRKVPRKKYEWLFEKSDHQFFLSRDMIERWSAQVPNAASSASHTYSIVDFAKHPVTPLPDTVNPSVLVSGVLCPKKGQLFFLREIAPRLVEAGIQCLMAGDESPAYRDYAAECREAADMLGDGVQLLGYRSDIAQLVSQVRAVCITSRYEGLMRTMIEAMATGRPVVSTDVASAREVLRIPGREAGHVFTADQPGEMAQSIVKLCREEAEAKTMAANGAAIARELFDRARVISAYEDRYDRLRSLGKSRAG